MTDISKNNKVFYFFIAASLLGIVVSTYYLFVAEESDSAQTLNSLKVAEISKTFNDIRLKRSGNLHWNQVARNGGDSLAGYDGDMVFSGKDSKVVISFDETQVTLNENSLITLSKDFIEVDKGLVEFETKANSKITVKAGSKTLDFKDGEKVVVRSQKENVEVIPLNPKAEKLSQDLKDVKIGTAAAELVAPLDNKVFIGRPSTKIRFSWRSISFGKPSSLEISDPSGKVVKSIESTKGFIDLPVSELFGGRYSWKVRDGNVVSGARNFEVLKDFEIKDLKTEKLDDSENDNNVRLSWVLNKRYNAKLVVSKSSMPEESVVDETISDKSSVELELAPGVYSWTVNSLTKNSEQLSTQVGEDFTIEEKIVPVSEIKFKRFFLRKNFSVKKSYEIIWLPIEGAEQYLFELTGRGDKILESKRFNQTSHQLQFLSNGSYHIRVSAFDNKKRKIGFRERSFTVKNQKPKPVEKKEVPAIKLKAPSAPKVDG